MESTRCLIEADMRIELVAYARPDGRWEAHVASWRALTPSRATANLLILAADLTSNRSAALWPSVNGPTSAVSLDALEAELRERISTALDALGVGAALGLSGRQRAGSQTS
jgi:hypothetical protein